VTEGKGQARAAAPNKAFRFVFVRRGVRDQMSEACVVRVVTWAESLRRAGRRTYYFDRPLFAYFGSLLFVLFRSLVSVKESFEE
jgi:hypothetical protein